MDNLEDSRREHDEAGSHLAGEEEIRAGNGDGVFRSLEEVSWL